MISVLAILLSGGDANNTRVEVFDPLTGQSCSLPAFPDGRWGHTMDKLFICGGYYHSLTCLSLLSGEWVATHVLHHRRYASNSWDTSQGLLILGGDDSPHTSEVVPADSNQQSFPMQYQTS